MAERFLSCPSNGTLLPLVDILLTGGLGYIGSHTATVLSAHGHNPVLLDNLSNSKKEVLGKIETITQKKIPFIEGDVRNERLLKEVFQGFKINAVIHFAGFKSVAESVAHPLSYFDNNVSGTVTLLKTMRDFGVRKLVFSSSATVYGVPQYLPIDEKHPTNPVNPYGQSKLMVEKILEDLAKSDPTWRLIALRYFNPVGAHPSGLIADEPLGKANNLMPRVVQVANTPGEVLEVFGNDYPTKDGTGVRDYINVMDLAEGHIAALKHLEKTSLGYDVFNLGTGKGSTVLEMLETYRKATGKEVPYKISPRRPGDIAECYAACGKANRELSWQSA